MIVLDSVKYRYASSQSSVLQSASLKVSPGEILAIIGENGSGKSTLGLIIAGLYRPQKGQITLNGTKYTRIPRCKLRQHIGILLQNPDAQIVFNDVQDDISFALKNLKIPKSEWDERIAAALEAVDMTNFLHANPYELSYGQKQRIALAGALALRPQCLILDEPTSMMDSPSRRRLYRLLAKLKSQNISIVLITNNPNELKYADRTLRLENGELTHV